MFLGKVLGPVVATTKSEGLTGIRFYLFQPVDENFASLGDPMVAVDTVGAREQDIVMWVASREASLALDHWFVPIDAAIVGIVDHCLDKTVGDKTL
ncbi:MAG: EutN/CcmL family microcompartment protein [Bdellovibrionales bacterium]